MHGERDVGRESKKATKEQVLVTKKILNLYKGIANEK
jgi:hypothetical protein